MRFRLAALAIFSALALAGASSGSLDLLGQWKNMGRKAFQDRGLLQ